MTPFLKTVLPISKKFAPEDKPVCQLLRNTSCKSEFLPIKRHIVNHVLCKFFLPRHSISVVSPIDVVNVNAKLTWLLSRVHVVKFHFRPLRVSVLKAPTIFTINTVSPPNVCNVVSRISPTHGLCEAPQYIQTVVVNNPAKTVCPVNSSKPVRLVDVRKSVRPANSNKPVYFVGVCKSLVPVDVCKPVCLVDIRKPFFVDYWRHVSLFYILLLSAVPINTSVFNKTILYIVLFTNIHMTYLIFTKSFKCTFVILTGNFLYIGDRRFKYSFLGIFIICKHVFKLLLIIFVMNFNFVYILYLNNVSFGAGNVKSINGMYSLTIMTEDFSNYGQKVLISVSVTPENTKSLDYILRNYLILTLISFCASVFCKNRVLNFSKLFISIFVIFLCFCKDPNNSIDSDLKFKCTFVTLTGNFLYIGL